MIKENHKIIFSNEELLDIKNSYLNGESCTKLAKKYNVNHHVILKKIA